MFVVLGIILIIIGLAKAWESDDSKSFYSWAFVAMIGVGFLNLVARN